MVRVEIIAPCSCAKKRKAWQKEMAYGSNEEAIQKAEALCEQGNNRFCKRHEFEYCANGDVIEIINKPKG